MPPLKGSEILRWFLRLSIAGCLKHRSLIEIVKSRGGPHSKLGVCDSLPEASSALRDFSDSWLAIPGFRGRSLRRQCLGPFLQVPKKRGQRYAQVDCNLVDVLEAQVALAALNRPHKRAVDAAFVGKSLLRVVLLRPQLSDSLTQSLQEHIGRSFFHVRKCC